MSKTGFSAKFIWLILALVLTSVFAYQHIDVQSMLAQGDHGRDLYAFDRATQGDRAYSDYWWVYGPIMPHYYGAFMQMLGANVPSVLIGQQMLVLLSALFFFLILQRLGPGSVAFAGTLFYVVFRQEFFYTFNHTGGVTLSILIIYFVLRYIQSMRMRYACIALFLVYLLGLVKINFALTALVFVILCVLAAQLWLNDKGERQPTGRFLWMSVIGVPLLLAGTYYLLLHDLPDYVIRQCFPYFSEDHPHNMSVFQALKIVWMQYHGITLGHWTKLIFAGLAGVSIVFGLVTLITKSDLAVPRRQLIVFTAGLLIYAGLNLHEFVVSGVYYRTFWSQPPALLFVFTFMTICAGHQSRLIGYLMAAVVIGITGVQSSRLIEGMYRYKIPERYWGSDRGKVYLPVQEEWIKTIEFTRMYLERLMDKDDQVFVMPYDPIYYYALNRKSPSRQLIFFEHINIPSEQEDVIVRNLEEKKVEWIILSNRIKSDEKGLGEFGKDYCPRVYRYIESNFQPVAEFGEWDLPAGWVENHATRVYRRIHIK